MWLGRPIRHSRSTCVPKGVRRLTNVLGASTPLASDHHVGAGYALLIFTGRWRVLSYASRPTVSHSAVAATVIALGSSLAVGSRLTCTIPRDDGGSWRRRRSTVIAPSQSRPLPRLSSRCRSRDRDGIRCCAALLYAHGARALFALSRGATASTCATGPDCLANPRHHACALQIGDADLITTLPVELAAAASRALGCCTLTCNRFPRPLAPSGDF